MAPSVSSKFVNKILTLFARI